MVGVCHAGADYVDTNQYAEKIQYVLCDQPAVGRKKEEGLLGEQRPLCSGGVYNRGHKEKPQAATFVFKPVLTTGFFYSQ